MDSTGTLNTALERRNDATLEDAFEDRIDKLQAEALSAADRRLAELGYTQVYKREFSWLSCISFAFAIPGTFGSVSTTFIYPLEAGGLPCTVWCWLISGAGCMCIALSVSELVSAYPTSGGLYFTCKYLAPKSRVAEVSWFCGWVNVLGQIAGLASTEYGVAQLLLAAVSMSTDFEYLPTARQTVGVMAGMTLIHATLNSLSTHWLEKMARTYVVFHLAVLVSACIALLVVCDKKHSTTEVWTEVVPDSGWQPTGFSFLLGFLSASWTMTGFDSTAHIAEEIREPERKAAWAITIAAALAYTCGWLYTIVLAYCAGSITDILDSKVEQPVAQIFYNVLGPTGGVAFTVCAFVILSCTGMTGMQAGARTFWALARDELLPGSKFWYRVSRTTHTPVRCVWLIGTLCVLINLIGLGSYTAIAAIFNVTAIALDWSFCIPVVLNMIQRRNFQPGPYYLGRAGWYINAWAVAWTTFITVIFVLPTELPVSPESMNYDSVIVVGIALFAIAYWYIAGRKYYTGPRIKAELI